MKPQNESHKHSITRRPCPHCANLCSSMAPKCPKCGEPLTPMEATASLEINEELIKEMSGERVYINRLEHKLGRKIPQVGKIKRGKIGFEIQEAQIVGLSVYKCGLNSLPTEILDLKGLKKLYLRRNKINVIPNALGLLENLEELDFSLNDLQAIPPSFGFLKNLRLLKLSSNKLRKIPKTLGTLPSLKMIDLTNNQLREIPEELIQNPNINISAAGNILLTLNQHPKSPKTKKKQGQSGGRKQKTLRDFI